MRHLLLLAILAPTPALAAPTYLDCQWNSAASQTPIRFKVTLNEDQGTADFFDDPSSPSPSVTKVRALFTASEVTFGDKYLRYVVNRGDLTLAVAGGQSGVRPGTCNVLEVPKRAF